MFENIEREELNKVNGGMPMVVGVVVAGGIVLATGTVTAGAIVLVGKAAQAFSDWIG